jgi:hypothetical protein
MADPPPQAPSRPPRRGTSIALICIGLLILVPSGLCTVVFGGMVSGETGAYAMVLMIGRPPIAIGSALLVWGLKRDRR